VAFFYFMANANFSLGLVNITEYLLIIAREVNDPTTEADRITYAPPQPTTRNVSFTGLNPTTHYFDFRSSSDGVDLGTLLATFVIDVGKVTDVIIDVVEFVVDRGLTHDPEDGDDQYDNSEIQGQTYVVFKPGFGPLSFEQNINDVATGGFKFIDGQKFNTAERYTLTVFKKVVTQTNDTGRGFPLSIVDLPADVTLGSSHFNKMMEASGGGTLRTATFPAFSSIPDGTKFGFNTHKASTRYLVLSLPAGATCYVDGIQRGKIYLGKGETITLIKGSGVLRVLEWDGDHRRVGQQVHQDMAPLNGLAELGGWFLKTDYPRFFDWYVNALPTSLLGSATYPATPNGNSITKFVISGLYFWMPDTGGFFIRNTDPDGDNDPERASTDRKPGTSQSSANLAHSHVVIAKAQTDGGVGALVGGGDNSTNDGSAITEVSGGAESRPRNVLQNAYRII
jgi:hypothetical protein